MVTLHCTAALLKRLRVSPALRPPPPTTRLGEWYATILAMRPAHLVLLVNEPSRLPVVVPARPLPTLLGRIPDAVARVLGDLGVEAAVVKEERHAMAEMAVAKTASRSVLGTMNEFVWQLRWLSADQPDLDEHALSLVLARGLVTIQPRGYEYPAEVASEILGHAPAQPKGSR